MKNKDRIMEEIKRLEDRVAVNIKKVQETEDEWIKYCLNILLKKYTHQIEALKWVLEGDDIEEE